MMKTMTMTKRKIALSKKANRVHSIFGMVQMKVTLPLCALCGLCGDIMLSSVYLHKFNGDNLTTKLTENTEEVLPKLERN